MIQIENWYIDSSTITIYYTLDSGYHESHYSIESFEVFLEANDLLFWDRQIFHGEEYVGDDGGKISFERYCKEFVNDDDLKLFLKQILG